MPAYWLFMLLVDLLIPFMMIAFGKRFMSRPPETINHLFGYRTRRSMKNRDTWEFAHQYCGRLWFRTGIALLSSVLPLLFVFGGDIGAVGIVGGVICCVQVLPLVLSAVLTEAALKRTFDESGNRRSG